MSEGRHTGDLIGPTSENAEVFPAHLGFGYVLSAALTTSFASACTSARWSRPRNDSA